MGDNWPELSLAEAPVQIIDGDRGIHYPKQHELYETGRCLFLDAGNVTNDGFKFSECAFIDAGKDASLGKGKLNRYDVALTTRGTVGNVAFYDASIPYENIRINSGMVILRPDSTQILPRFLYMFLRSSTFKNQVKAFLTGSAQPQLPVRDIMKLRLPLPSLPEQCAIASILGALDDKIDLLRRQNKTLENVAQLLFKNWFIDFEFPDEKGQPYKSSRGKMIPHRDFGEIPEGWIHSKIGREIEILGGGTPSTDEPSYWEGGNIDWYTPTDLTSNNDLFSLGSARKITGSGLANSSAKVFPEYSLMMSSRATIGEIAINTKKSCTNQGFITLIANENYPIYFLHCWLLRQLKMIKKLASGSTFPEIGRGEFNDLDIIKPTPEVMIAFRNLVEPTYRKIENNIKESKSLTSIRDILLPKLMSGQIRVT